MDKLVFESPISLREAYGKSLAFIGEQNKKLLVLDADLSKSTKTNIFAKKFPNRFFNLGISEANMVAVAAGLAIEGFIPFVNSFSSFLLCRAFDVLRMSVSYSNKNVKVVGSHAGINIGEDGASQMAIEDLALALSLPAFEVYAPSDGISMFEIVKLVVNSKKPCYIRSGRPKFDLIYKDFEHDFSLGLALLKNDSDVLVVSCSTILHELLKAYKLAKKDGYSFSLIDCYRLKPFNYEYFKTIVENKKAVVVVQEHLKDSGLFSVISQYTNKIVKIIGLDDYAQSGTMEELLDFYGLSARKLYKQILDVIRSV